MNKSNRKRFLMKDHSLKLCLRWFYWSKIAVWRKSWMKMSWLKCPKCTLKTKDTTKKSSRSLIKWSNSCQLQTKIIPLLPWHNLWKSLFINDLFLIWNSSWVKYTFPSSLSKHLSKKTAKVPKPYQENSKPWTKNSLS